MIDNLIEEKTNTEKRIAKAIRVEFLVINFWAFLRRLTKNFRKHNYEYIGTAECYHQKSKLGKCSKCGNIGFVPKYEKDFRMLNTFGCDASPKHL